MAKSNKVRSTNPETTENIDNEASETTVEEGTVKPRADKARGAALLAAWKKCDEAVKAAQVKLDEAESKRTEAIKTIYEECGPGPFSYKGEYLGRCVERKGSYFFRGRTDTEIQSYD